MFTFMAILLMILSVLLVLIVLIQPGKGDMISGMGSLGGTFSNMLGSRRAMDLLSKITWGFAIAILVLSLTTNYFFVGQETQVIRPAIEGAAVPQTVPTQIPQAIPDIQNTEQENSGEEQGGSDNNE
jgi:preprotein translocase subunit SecG